MLDLNDLYYFVQVVDHKGFAPAGRALNLPKSSLSRRVIELEDRLRVRLINRTSRSFTVTDLGQEFYERAVAMLAEARAAEDVVRRRVVEPSGPVRFSVAMPIAQFALANLLPLFMAQFPRVSIAQNVTNRAVDLYEENFDLAIRAHSAPLPDSSLIARSIGCPLRYLVVSPKYLQDHAIEDTPQELSNHALLAFSTPTADETWTLHHVTGEEVTIPVSPRLLSDDFVTLKLAVEANLGIAVLPAFICRSELRNGRLRRVLPSWTAGSVNVTLLSTTRRNTLPSVRAFAEFLMAELPSALEVE